MSHSRRLSLEPAIQRDHDDDDVINKPDFRELDLGSPVSTLMPRVSSSSSSSAAATPTSSSGSSGSASVKPSVTSVKSHSGEILTGSGMYANRNLKTGHRRSASTGTPLIFSGSSGATSAASPNPTVLPAGNICPSGRIFKTGMVTRVSSRTETTLFTGNGNYGHGNVVRSGGGINGKTNQTAAESSEEMKRLGNFGQCQRFSSGWVT